MRGNKNASDLYGYKPSIDPYYTLCVSKSKTSLSKYKYKYKYFDVMLALIQLI